MKAFAIIAALALCSCGVPIAVSVTDTDDQGNTISAGYSSKAGLTVGYSSK
jgi:hypothetical protein